MAQGLSDEQIRRVFAEVGIADTGRIRKIEIGFSNDVYSVGEEYVLKASRTEEDEEGLRREVYLCGLLAGAIPAPEVVASDTSKRLTDRVLIIYRKIPGDNLYQKWHLFSEDQRRELTRQICAILRKINDTSYDQFAARFDIGTCLSWRDRVLGRIGQHLAGVSERGILPPELADPTKRFVEANSGALLQQRMALTYHDPHFDNFIVSDGRIAGILDFERTDVLSTDYVLDLVGRMVRYPTKYASAESEKHVRAEHYAKLLEWYGEFYPELFEYEDLHTRLALYSVEHSLAELFYFPGSKRAVEELCESVGYVVDG